MYGVMFIKCVDEVGVLINFVTENAVLAESGNKRSRYALPFGAGFVNALCL